MALIQFIANTYPPTKDGKANRILTILSWYPFIWTVGVLVYALVKIKYLIFGIMLSWVLYLYFGLLTWLGLLIFLSIKQRITIKQTLLHVIIFLVGTLVAYYVYENNILGSGVKFMD